MGMKTLSILGIFGAASLFTSIILEMLNVFIPKLKLAFGIFTLVIPTEFKTSVYGVPFIE